MGEGIASSGGTRIVCTRPICGPWYGRILPPAMHLLACARVSLAEVAADEPDLTPRRQVPTVEGQFLGGKLYQQFRAAEDGRLPPSCRCTGQQVRGISATGPFFT